jgi:hypothetical protein
MAMVTSSDGFRLFICKEQNEKLGVERLRAFLFSARVADRFARDYLCSMNWLPSLGAALLLVLLASNTFAKDLGDGFVDHGVAVPISNHRGAVATVDGDGRDVLLLWLMDHRGGYELLLIDAETGKSEEFPIPFENDLKDSPYASLLSSKNKFYTHFGNYFVEFDPTQRKFTFSRKTAPQMAMGMTEDDNGVIWSATYPQSGIVSYDPATKKFRDYGHCYKQNWPEYPRYIAADDTGAIYFSLGNTASQIVSLDRESGRAKPILPENERTKGIAFIYRDLDGKVYGRSSTEEKDNWYELYKGDAKKIGKHDTVKPKEIITGSQGLFHTKFPDGKILKDCDLVNRKLRVEDPKTKKISEHAFDYSSDGAIIMGCAVAPDNTISGGTAFPFRFYSYDPKADKIINRTAYVQWNTITRRGDHFFVGGYGGGFILDWTPAKPWVDTVKGSRETNPAYILDSDPVVHRPTCLLAYPDNKTMILAGTPQYGYTGGGLHFWNTETDERKLLTDAELIPDQSTESLVAIDNGKLVGGTTTTPGTGGEKKAKQAELYIMDFAKRAIEWHAALIPGVQEYTELHVTPEKTIYGIADRKILFVFDPAKREITYQRDVSKELGESAYQQGPRIFIDGLSDTTYVLFVKGIARLDPKTHALTLVAKAPTPVESGGDYLDGRIYFVSGSHLCSWQVK